MWETSQTNALEGQVRIAIGAGGAWEPLAGLLNRLNDPYQAIIWFDSKGELRLIGLTSGAEGIYPLAPRDEDTTGVLIEMLGKTSIASAQLVSRMLHGRAGDPEWGMSQTPPISWMAVGSAEEEIRSTLELVVQRMIELCAGTLKKAEVHVFWGTGGGSGSGASRRILTIFRQVFRKRAPDANLAIRRFVLDGLSWIGCGARVPKNAAVGAAIINADANNDPYMNTRDNQWFLLCTLPDDKTDRDLRSRHVRQLGAMLLHRKFYHEAETEFNNDMPNTDILGNVHFMRPIFIGHVMDEDVQATAALAYLPELVALESSQSRAVGFPLDIRHVVAEAATRQRPHREIDEVIGDIRTTNDRDESLMAQLAGVYTATADVMVEMVDGKRVLAAELLEVDHNDYREVQLLLANELKIAEQLSIAKAAGNRELNRAKRAYTSAMGRLTQIWRFMYGDLADKLSAPFIWPKMLLNRRTSRREAILRSAARKVRGASETLAQAEAKLDALNQIQSHISAQVNAVRGRLQHAMAVLRTFPNKGTALEDGIVMKPLGTAFRDLMWATSQVEHADWTGQVLLVSVDSLSVDALCRWIFGYNDRLPANPADLARFLEGSRPGSAGVNWGGKDRSADTCDRYIFLPLSDRDMEAVAEVFRRDIRTGIQMMRLPCDAGIFIGGCEIRQAKDGSDVVTNLYASLLDEMAEKEGDLEQSLVPDAPLLPDPRESQPDSEKEQGSEAPQPKSRKAPKQAKASKKQKGG